MREEGYNWSYSWNYIGDIGDSIIDNLFRWSDIAL